MGAIRSLWTNEAAVARFRELVAASKSYSDIASILNKEFGCYLTRNATIGKAHRMGLYNGRGWGSKTSMTGVSKPRAERRGGFVIRKRPADASTLPPSSFPAPSAVTDPTEHNCTIFNLTNETCRWPLGKWNEPATLFCGDPTANLALNRPYCGLHMIKASGWASRVR